MKSSLVPICESALYLVVVVGSFAMGSKHDNTAIRIARKKVAQYNRGPGPDIITSRQVIEVETKDTVADAFRQLRGFRRPVYIAGADAEATKAALEATQDTTVGVMNSRGRILKRSSRRRK